MGVATPREVADEVLSVAKRHHVNVYPFGQMGEGGWVWVDRSTVIVCDTAYALIGAQAGQKVGTEPGGGS